MPRIRLHHPRPLRNAPFCERQFGAFLVLWGLLLQYDYFIQKLSPGGLFYGRFEFYAPGWAWGAGMIALGVGRFLAYCYGSASLRLSLSTATVILFWVVASLALFSGLLAVSFPLSAFIGSLALWCHRSLTRDIKLGI